MAISLSQGTWVQPQPIPYVLSTAFDRGPTRFISPGMLGHRNAFRSPFLPLPVLFMTYVAELWQVHMTGKWSFTRFRIIYTLYNCRDTGNICMFSAGLVWFWGGPEVWNIIRAIRIGNLPGYLSSSYPLEEKLGRVQTVACYHRSILDDIKTDLLML